MILRIFLKIIANPLFCPLGTFHLRLSFYILWYFSVQLWPSTELFLSPYWWSIETMLITRFLDFSIRWKFWMKAKWLRGFFFFFTYRCKPRFSISWYFYITSWTFRKKCVFILIWKKKPHKIGIQINKIQISTI